MNQCNAIDRAAGALNLMELRYRTQDQEELLLALHVRLILLMYQYKTLVSDLQMKSRVYSSKLYSSSYLSHDYPCFCRNHIWHLCDKISLLSFVDDRRPLDFGFLVDSSPDISRENWQRILWYMRNVIDRLSSINHSPYGTRVGVLSYASITHLHFDFNFLRGFNLNKERVKAHINSLPRQPGNDRRLGDAIDYTRRNLFSRKGGARPNSRRVSLVISRHFLTQCTYRKFSIFRINVPALKTKVKKKKQQQQQQRQTILHLDYGNLKKN